MGAKEMLKESAGKVPAIKVMSPTIMEPSGDVPGSITIEPPDGKAEMRPNSVAAYGEPVKRLMDKARGGSR